MQPLEAQVTMIPFRRLPWIVIALSATPAVGGAQSGDIEPLAFLAGCWELRTPTRVTHEQWMSPLGGVMLGMSRTVVADRAREWEALHISVRDGVVTYAAQPGGRPATYFGATLVTDSSVTFANPEHDFPQRIIYRRRGADSLIARIEGEVNGQARGIDFPMRRVACG